MKFLRRNSKKEALPSGESDGVEADQVKEIKRKGNKSSPTPQAAIVPVKSWIAFGSLLALALIFVAQAVYVGRSGEFDTFGLENDLAKLRVNMASSAKKLSSIIEKYPDPSQIHLSQIQEEIPQARDLVVWDRRTLDSRYDNMALAKASGFARLSAAERLIEEGTPRSNNNLTTYSARFYRPSLGKDTFVILSYKHQDKVIQVLSPANEILDDFKDLVPEGVPAVLLQNGNTVSSVFSGDSLDLTSYEVSSVGTAELSLALKVPTAPSYWLATPIMQYLLAFVLVLIAAAVVYIPHRNHRRSFAPSQVRNDTVKPVTSSKIAPVVAIPISKEENPHKRLDKGSESLSQDEVVGVQATPSPNAGPSVPTRWFVGSGLFFSGEDEAPLPDSSQVRALMRALSEQAFGEDHVGKTIIVISDGKEVSESISKWACEGLSSIGCSVQMCPALPLSVLPVLEKLRSTPENDPSISLWVGSSSDDPEHSGMMVFEDGKAWSSPDYSRWRLRMEERGPTLGVPVEGQQSLFDLDGMIPAMINKMSSSMQVESPIRVVMDFGNGPLGVLALEVLDSVGIEVIPLHAEMDSDFPNRQARIPSGWSSLATTVRQFRASFGVGVSLDGTGLVILDEEGHPVAPHRVFAMLASDALIMTPGVRVEFNPEGMGEDTLAAIQRAGGIPVPVEGLDMYSALNASVPVSAKASESFGFYRMAEDDGIPDAMHVVARLAVHLSSESASLSERLSALFDSPEGQ